MDLCPSGPNNFSDDSLGPPIDGAYIGKDGSVHCNLVKCTSLCTQCSTCTLLNQTEEAEDLLQPYYVV